MVSSFLLAVSVATSGPPNASPTPAPEEVTVNADGGERLLPVQARVSLTGLFGQGSAFGGNLYLGYTLGRLHRGRGPFLGLGVQAHLGRIDVGVNSVAWSRSFLRLSGHVVNALNGSDLVVLGLGLLPLVLLNNLELSLEWSQGSIDHDGFKAGLSIGAGF